MKSENFEVDETLNFPEDLIINNPPVMKKKSGKQKIEMKPIANKSSRQVTFSKRRTGLFKKASELCNLCGSEVAVITFSGAGKLFSFGHPNTDTVVNRYINYTLGVDNTNNIINSGNNGNFGVLSEEYNKVMSNIEVEKRRTNNVNAASSSSSSNNEFGFWWDKPIENLGLSELEQLKVSLEGLRDEVYSRVNSINHNNNNNNNGGYNWSTNQDMVDDQKESVSLSSLLSMNDSSAYF